MVMRHHEELRQKEEKAKRDEQSKIRKVAASIAKEVRAFWSSVEKVVGSFFLNSIHLVRDQSSIKQNWIFCFLWY